MGYDNEGAALRYMVADIETGPREDVAHLIPEPEADKRLTDPAKITADIDKKRAASLDKLSLDPNGCRIVAIGWQTEAQDEPVVQTLPTREAERLALQQFWQVAKGRRLIGFVSRRFDLPVIIQRSRYHGIPVAWWRDLIAPYGRAKGSVDLYDDLTFDGGRGDGVVPCTLKAFCQQFHIDIPDDDGGGKDIKALLEAGDWDGIRHHCSRDVARTVALARATFALPDVVKVSKELLEDCAKPLPAVGF